MAAPVAVLSILVTANTKQAQASLTQLDARLKSTEGTASKVGKVLSTGLKVSAFGAAAGLAYAVDKAADFEQQMSRLGAVTSANERQMKRLERSAMRLGAATKFSALEAAEAQTELAKGGLSVERILKGGLKSALALASAGELDLAEAASTTANAIKLFGLRGKDSMKVADALAVAANRTTADVEDFAMALKMGGSVAKLAGLNFRDTVVVLEALAEAGIKNSDAGTSLKTFFLQIATPSAKAREAMHELGVEIFKRNGELKSLPGISKNLQKAFGDLTREEFLNKAGIIAGSDAVRTLYSLYDAGPQKLRKLQMATDQAGYAAEVARKKQDNLRGDLEKLQGAVETLAISFGKKLLPSLRTAVQDVTDVLSDKTISTDEKIRRLGELMAQGLGKVAPKVVKAAFSVGADVARGFIAGFRELPLWGKVLTAGIIAKLMFGGGGGASAAFKARGQTAGQAFAGGFRGAIFGSAGAALVEVLGNRLAKSGGILGKIGGVVGRPGASVSNALWVKVVPGFGGGGGLGGKGGGGLPDVLVGPGGKQMGGKLGRVLFKATKAVPVLGTVLVGVEIARELGLRLPERNRATTEAEARARGGQKAVREFRERQQTPSSRAVQGPVGDPRALRGIEAGAGTKNEALIASTVKLGVAAKQARKNIADLRKMAGGDMDALRAKVTRNLGEISQKFNKDSTAAKVYTQRNFAALGTAIQNSVQKGRASVRDAMETIKTLVRVNSKGSKDAASANFLQIRKAIGRSMDGSVRIADKGNKLLRQLFAAELANFGFTKQEIKFRLQGKDFTGKNVGAGSEGNLAVSGGQQRGGFINMGKPSGDSVHAVLEKGEYVLNRKAVAKAGGQKALDAFNFGVAPRMQSGGIIRLGRQLQRQGYLVGENPAFGGVHPVHVDNSWHYRGQALDVNWPDAGAEPRMLDRLYARLKNMRGVVELLWRVAGHFDHLHVALSPGAGGGLGGIIKKLKRLKLAGGEGSPLHDLVQAGLDRVRSAANTKLALLSGTMEGIEPGLGGDAAQNLRLGQQLAARYGWTGAQWRALRELWQRESGWSSMARNPSSGAFGIPQALPATKMPAAAQRGDAGAQILWGLNYIKDRYGSPAAALAFHNAHNWYQAGGPVGMLFGGGARTAANPYGPLATSPLFAGSPFAQPFGSDLRRKAGQPSRLFRQALQGARQTGKLLGVKRLLARTKKIGLSAKLTKEISSLAENASMFEEHADRAGNLNITDDAGNLISEGVVKGHNETYWVQKQLDSLFALRNRLIQAVGIIAEKRQVIGKFIDRATERAGVVKAAIGAADARKGRLEKQLKQLKKHPKANKEKIKAVQKLIDGIDSSQKVRRREQKALQKILPGLRGQSGDLLGARKDYLDQLQGPDGVQAKGDTMQILDKLPKRGILGGQIFQVQTRLEGLTGAKAASSDSGSSETVDAIKELLRQANLRTAVSETALRTFQFARTDPFLRAAGLPFAGSFQTGGVVPGLPSQASMAIVHGQERIIPSGDAPNVQVILGPGMEWLDRYIEVKVDGVTRKQANPARAPLPGRGGGLQRR